MLFSHEEYQSMYEVEEKLWWYRILHEKVIDSIIRNFSSQDIDILDAGCGTGGMMNSLIKTGYTLVEGFDYAISAVEFTKSRNLNVRQLDIAELALNQDEKFDVVISNDVMYSLDHTLIREVFQNVTKVLKPGGVFITNNNAFTVFKGIHDEVLGGKHRFTLPYFKKIVDGIPNLEIQYSTYWSLFLAIPILVVRLLQQIQLKFGFVDISKQKSDVQLPSDLVNRFFYSLVKQEEKLFKRAFFGSSLFLVIKKSI